MKYILQMFAVMTAAFLAFCSAEEIDIENHPAFKVDEIPTPYNSLRVAAFNIQVFGVSKMGKPEVVNCLKRILVRYDITLIQEIRDSSDTAIHQLLAEVNSMGQGTYAMALSARLGRTSSKEQYAYFYKTSIVSVVATYQWPDTSDIYEREPYIVRFRASNYAVGDFGFIGIHVKPEDAVNEIDKLTDVYNSMTSMWNLQDFILGGDFNAACTYVRPADWANIRLRQDSRFLWVIGDSIDTTSTTTNCAYDRLVLAGSRLRGAYFTGTAVPYNYETALGISNALALEVSDHYPVEMSLD
jgi:endonuclease/exonuclease/phosphatase family metal-dependent hydrolase